MVKLGLAITVLLLGSGCQSFQQKNGNTICITKQYSIRLYIPLDFTKIKSDSVYQAGMMTARYFYRNTNDTNIFVFLSYGYEYFNKLQDEKWKSSELNVDFIFQNALEENKMKSRNSSGFETTFNGRRNLITHYEIPEVGYIHDELLTTFKGYLIEIAVHRFDSLDNKRISYSALRDTIIYSLDVTPRN